MNRRIIAVLIAVLVLASAVTISSSAASGKTISYSFNNSTPGYAEGTVTFKTDTDGSFILYWADDNKKLSGYYPIINEFSLSAGGSKSFTFGKHTAVPYNATRVIAVDKDGNTAAEYSIPAGKRLKPSAGSLNYKFNAFSDLHIDLNGFYKRSDTNWAQALDYGVREKTDFIVFSGDVITNAANPTAEWKRYEKILSESDYVNPVWESNGNHDLRNNADEGRKAYMRGSGTDNTIANYDANKSYYYITEKTTGDIFIFMALEKEYSPAKCDEFSDAQMKWMTNLIENNYGKGKNIYIVEHSPINGFGAGDRMSKPYYKAHLSEEFPSTVKFKSLLKKYPGLIFMSGHTHEDFSLGYNFSNENGTACSMIHIPALAGSTIANDSDSALEYQDGWGENVQGYIVEAYENEVVFYGANITEKKIYPYYSYIMEGSGSSNVQPTTNATDPTDVTVETQPQNGCTIPAGVETKRVYFADKNIWGSVYCHSWGSGSNVKSVWPGYYAKYYGTTDEGVDLYYADIPADHTGIVWNNGDEDEQTVDITLDSENNFFTPKKGQSGKKIEVEASVWTYEPVTEPPTDEPETETGSVTVPSSSAFETTEATQPSGDTEPSTTEKTSKPAEETEKETTSAADTTKASDTAADTTRPETGSSFMYGDVNMDSSVNIRDVTAVQKHLALMLKLSDAQLKLADVNLNGTVNIKDASLIQKYIAKLVLELPVKSSDSAKKTVGAQDYKQMLENYYSFSSYDQYQALKKLYKNGASETKLSEAAAKLKAIADHIGGTGSYRDTYYVENTKNWDKMYAYAWKGSSKNAEWPGVKLSKVGTNAGHDVYKVKFSSAGQFTSIIFNAGGGSSKTINIDLADYTRNAFYLTEKDSEGRYKVGSFKFSE